MDSKGVRSESRSPIVAGGDSVRGVGEHRLEVINREQVTIQGVVSVESFDDEEIVLETEMGTLTVRGEELHIRQLDLESGRFAVEGLINGCLYTAPRQRGVRPAKSRGFLERLFR